VTPASIEMIPVLLVGLLLAAILGRLSLGGIPRRWLPSTIALAGAIGLYFIETVVEVPGLFETPRWLDALIRTVSIVALAAVAYMMRLAFASHQRQSTGFAATLETAQEGLAAAPVAVLDLDRDGIILAANRHATDLLGATTESLVGKDLIEVAIDASQQAAFRQDFEAFRRTNGLAPISSVCRITGSDTRRIVRWTRSPRLNDEGTLIGLVMYGEDVTGLVAAEETLARYRILATEARDVILFVRERDARIVEANAAAIRMYGYSHQELLTLTYSDLHSEGSAPTALDELQTDGEARESMHARSDGSPFPVEVSSQGTSSIGGEPTVLLIVRDLTERKRIDRELADYRSRLRGLAEQVSVAADDERRRLATELHDRVSQPIAAAKLRLELLMRTAPQLGGAEALQESIDLLSDAVKESRAITSEMRPPLLYDVGLGAALAWLADEERRYGVDCTVHTEVDDIEDEDVKTFVFRTARELLANVAKHSGAERAELYLREVGDDLELVVRDSGHGFDASSLKQLPGDERGFGLFSITEAALKMRADVDVRSEPGAGTTVTVRVARSKRDGSHPHQGGRP